MTDKIRSLTDLAQFLRILPDNDDADAAAGFDMRASRFSEDTNHPCGTAACIGGWVRYINRDSRQLVRSVEALGVPYLDADQLCFPPSDHPAWDATPEQAARCVEILRDEEVVDWDRAMREVN